MFLGARPIRSEISRANCAGQGCPEREQCRRYRVRLDLNWEAGTGQWISADLERAALGGECPSFKRYISERPA